MTSPLFRHVNAALFASIGCLRSVRTACLRKVLPSLATALPRPSASAFDIGSRTTGFHRSMHFIHDVSGCSCMAYMTHWWLVPTPTPVLRSCRGSATNQERFCWYGGGKLLARLGLTPPLDWMPASPAGVPSLIRR